MADAAVENKEVPVVEKESEEVAEKIVADKTEKTEKAENGTEEVAKENGDSEKAEEEPTPAADDDDTSNGDASNGDSKKEPSGDKDAPAEAVKRKVGEVSETAEEISPEKKAKLDDAKEVETNGAESTEVAA